MTEKLLDKEKIEFLEGKIYKFKDEIDTLSAQAADRLNITADYIRDRIYTSEIGFKDDDDLLSILEHIKIAEDLLIKIKTLTEVEFKIMELL